MGVKTLLTIDQLERLPEAEGLSYELDQGELVEVSSASYLHNRIRDLLTHRLMSHLETHKDQGTVVAEQWFRLGEDTVRAPDVALISPPQIALLDPERRIQPFAPALAVEVTSPPNTFDELARKTRQYLGAGSRSVWILAPAMRENPRVHLRRASGHPLRRRLPGGSSPAPRFLGACRRPFPSLKFTFKARWRDDGRYSLRRRTETGEASSILMGK
jgi:Uma2 family endonuclease